MDPDEGTVEEDAGSNVIDQFFWLVVPEKVLWRMVFVIVVSLVEKICFASLKILLILKILI